MNTPSQGNIFSKSNREDPSSFKNEALGSNAFELKPRAENKENTSTPTGFPQIQHTSVEKRINHMQPRNIEKVINNPDIFIQPIFDTEGSEEEAYFTGCHHLYQYW